MGELSFYDTALSNEQFAALYQNAQLIGNEMVDAGIRSLHTGDQVEKYPWGSGSDWEQALSLPLNRAEDLDKFYIQGLTDAPKITEAGLQVTTATKEAREIPKPADWDDREPWDNAQVYLWLKDYFTGDFAVEYQFKSLQNHGLSLLMTRAAGLQGEDFLKHHPQRKSGSMRMVAWENVRNYHWEYYRQMEDCRNDVASHVLVKNPYLHPLA
jgi:hypothetical protein